jgi:hypothetical protein
MKTMYQNSFHKSTGGTRYKSATPACGFCILEIEEAEFKY